MELTARFDDALAFEQACYEIRLCVTKTIQSRFNHGQGWIVVHAPVRGMARFLRRHGACLARLGFKRLDD